MSSMSKLFFNGCDAAHFFKLSNGFLASEFHINTRQPTFAHQQLLLGVEKHPVIVKYRYQYSKTPEEDNVSTGKWKTCSGMVNFNSQHSG